MDLFFFYLFYLLSFFSVPGETIVVRSFRLNRYFTVITGIVIAAYLGYIDFSYSA